MKTTKWYIGLILMLIGIIVTIYGVTKLIHILQNYSINFINIKYCVLYLFIIICGSVTGIKGLKMN